MQRDFLARLHCPYSGSPLSLSKIIRADSERIDYGIVASEAGDFPIAAGILRLQLDEYRVPIVEHVRERRLAEALSVALDDVLFHDRKGAAIDLASRLAFRAGFARAGNRLTKLKRNLASVVTDHDATFKQIAEQLGSNGSAAWQIYRFSMPTFLPVFALLHLVKRDSWILDFGCGTGQASFLISRMFPNSEIVCADYSFFSLYLAQKYFVPDASYVCLDGNYMLPFESGEFSTVFSSDTLHCIDSKLSLAQEFKRIGCEKAITILPHLHNRLASPYAKSLTPAGYRTLFQGMQMQIMPEQEVVRDYFFDDFLDLARDCSDEELAASQQGLSIVASGDSAVFTRRQGFWEQRIRSFRHPCINPAYGITGEPGDWELSRHVNDRYAKTFTGRGKTCLPDTVRVTTRSLNSPGLLELQGSDPTQFAQLARSLVVLDLPERFMPENLASQNGHAQLSARKAV